MTHNKRQLCRSQLPVAIFLDKKNNAMPYMEVRVIWTYWKRHGLWWCMCCVSIEIRYDYIYHIYWIPYTIIWRFPTLPLSLKVLCRCKSKWTISCLVENWILEHVLFMYSHEFYRGPHWWHITVGLFDELVQTAYEPSLKPIHGPGVFRLEQQKDWLWISVSLCCCGNCTYHLMTYYIVFPVMNIEPHAQTAIVWCIL